MCMLNKGNKYLAKESVFSDPLAYMITQSSRQIFRKFGDELLPKQTSPFLKYGVSDFNYREAYI